MDNSENMETLDYNIGREKVQMPEYGRNVLKMVRQIKACPDKDLRTRQAYATVKVMELLNPQVRTQENYVQKLWDHLYMIADYDLNIDAPYPCPAKEFFETRPVPVPMKGERIKATHYGRNIEKILSLICDLPDSEQRTEMIRSLAIYMRTQYLIWNKDSVADETIFNDMVRLSEGRLTIPEGLQLGEVSSDASFSRPGMSVNQGGGGKSRGQRRKNNKRKK